MTNQLLDLPLRSIFFCLIIPLLGSCETDNDLALQPHAGHLTYEMLSPRLLDRLYEPKEIRSIGAYAARLGRKHIDIRTDQEVGRYELTELLLNQFGNEDGLTEFLETRGEPAFDYALYPDGSARSNVAVVPVVLGVDVSGYIFYSLDADSLQNGFVDYIDRYLLHERLRTDYTIQDREDVKYLWILASAKYQLDYWLLDEVDTVSLNFLAQSEQLFQSGLLSSRNCNGVLVQTCWEQPVQAFISEPTCESCFAYRMIAHAPIEMCATTCQGGYDGPYIPAGTISGGGINLRDGEDTGGNSDICSDGGSGDSGSTNSANPGGVDGRGRFPGGDLGGNDGAGGVEGEASWHWRSEAAVARVDRILAKLQVDRYGANLPGRDVTRIAASIRNDISYANILESMLDEYRGAVRLSDGVPVERQIAIAAGLAAWQGGCGNAMRQQLEDIVREEDWVDYQGLVDACPRAFNIVERLIDNRDELFRETLRSIEGTQAATFVRFATTSFPIPGQTAARRVGGQWYVDIYLSEQQCGSASCDELASTLLHECIHAHMYSRVIEPDLDPHATSSYTQLWQELAGITAPAGTSPQHALLTYNDQWVNRMAVALNHLSGSELTPDHYKFLAWNGLRDYTNRLPDDLFEPEGVLQSLNRTRAAQNSRYCE